MVRKMEDRGSGNWVREEHGLSSFLRAVEPVWRFARPRGRQKKHPYLLSVSESSIATPTIDTNRSLFELHYCLGF